MSTTQPDPATVERCATIDALAMTAAMKRYGASADATSRAARAVNELLPPSGLEH